MANINFIYDNDDFTLETVIDNGVVVNQGQNESLEFRFYFGSFTTGSFVNTLTYGDAVAKPCLLNIERPDGSSSNNVATTAISNSGDVYFKLAVSDWFTEFSGTLKITPKIVDYVNDTITSFGLGSIQILPSSSVAQDTIEDAQYQALLSYITTIANDNLEVIADGDINQLDLVMFSGTVGGSGKIKVKKADIDIISANPEYVVGIALTDALNNETFYIKQRGIIKDVDTTAFEEGKVLVPSATVDGGLIEFDNVNAPKPPKSRMPIAVCIYSHQNHGILIVRPTYFPRMSQVKDVDIDYEQMSQGQGLVWDNTNKKFIAGFSGGVFYDSNLPVVDERFTNLTWFDQSDESIATWVLPTVYWQPYAVSLNQLRFVRTLVDSYGAYSKATKIEILNSGMQLLVQNTDQNFLEPNIIDWYNSWTNYLIPYQFYYVKITFEYLNQDDIIVLDTRIAPFQFIV